MTTLTDEEIVDWLQENTPTLHNLFGLDDWEINYGLQADLQGSASAQVTIDAHHNVAHVIIDPTQHVSIADLKKSTEHELIHVLCAPYEAVEQYVNDLKLNTKLGAMLARQFYHAAEQTQINIRKALNRQLHYSNMVQLATRQKKAPIKGRKKGKKD